MERRIKIIWLLSLTSMLLIGAGQGYWLWSHYQYTNEAYGREVLRQVSEAVVSYNTLPPCVGRNPVPWANRRPCSGITPTSTGTTVPTR